MGGSNSHAKFKENLQTLQHLEKIIFDLNKGNIDQTVELSLNYLPEDFPYSYFHVICRVIYSYFVAKGFEKLCIEFIQNMEITTKNKIFDIFSQFLLSINSQESNYLIVNMLENRLIDPKIIQNKNNSYFEQYFLGDKHIKEGLNPLELANIIRNDGIENLQEISSQKNFNFNQSIEPTLYERCSFINKRYVSLIDFAAYFSAVRCFKYLLTKGAIVNETGKYAIAGGNEEIVHLCEQNHSTFEDAYEIAIEFHRNNIFKYFFENKIIEIHNLEKLGEKCILHDNYEIFSFLEENGMKINKNIINDSFITGNTFLFQYFQEKTSISINFYDIPSFCGNEEFFRYFANSGYIDIKSRGFQRLALSIASSNGHGDIVKIILKQKGIKINAKDFNKQTALMHASQKGYTEIVKSLLEYKGIDINIKDKFGYTALMYASQEGHTETVKLLLEQKGIDIDAKNKGGNTTLMIASKKGYNEIVQLFNERKN